MDDASGKPGRVVGDACGKRGRVVNDASGKRGRVVDDASGKPGRERPGWVARTPNGLRPEEKSAVGSGAGRLGEGRLGEGYPARSFTVGMAGAGMNVSAM